MHCEINMTHLLNMTKQVSAYECRICSQRDKYFGIGCVLVSVSSLSSIDQTCLSGFGRIRVNSPFGEQKRWKALAEMQSGNPSAVV